MIEISRKEMDMLEQIKAEDKEDAERKIILQKLELELSRRTGYSLHDMVALYRVAKTSANQIDYKFRVKDPFA